MMAARRLGMPDTAIQTLCLTLLYNSSEGQKTSSKFGRLGASLGAWVQQPNQFWDCYYDFHQECLFTNVEGSNGLIHYKYHTKGRPTRFCSHFTTTSEATATFQHSNSIIPAEARTTSDSKFLLGTYAESKQTRPVSALRHRDFKEYIKSLPPERRRLMSWNRPWEGMSLAQSIKNIKQCITRNGRLETGTDGGLLERLGSFGCVIADNHQPLWICAGPTDMEASTANSSRPELAGYAGLWETILMLTIVFPSIVTKQKIEIRTWIDSTSILRRLKTLRGPTWGHRAYPADADLSAHVQWLWSQLPAYIPSFHWVKSHQDDEAPFSSLSHSAKLNIIADTLATQYLQQAASTRRPRSKKIIHYFSLPQKKVCW